ncbi:hypothetical protein CR513_33044, partial [Mucuna pruriens]
MNISFLEKTRDMLRTMGLAKSFWAEAVKTACYVINRSPSTAIGLSTPMEVWNGKPADYSSLRVFGCPVYVILSMYNSQERTKLDPKSRKCIFLGYADNVKGYRLWDPTAHKVIVSKDVVLEENELRSEQKNGSTTKDTTIRKRLEKMTLKQNKSMKNKNQIRLVMKKLGEQLVK